MKTTPAPAVPRAKNPPKSTSARIRQKRETAPAATTRPAVAPELRHQMIATAAYFHAERRGFAGGSELQDWIEAEAEIDRMLFNRG